MPLRIFAALVGWLAVAAPALAAIEPFSYTIGGTTAPGDPGDMMWQRYLENARTLSGGAAEVKSLIRGETGGEENMMGALRRNRIQVAGFSESGMSKQIPEYAVINLPFLFASAAEADFVIDRYLADFFRALTQAQGMEILSWMEVGFMNLYERVPLLAPDDAKGRRLRALQSRSSILFIEAIGADVINVTIPELIPSLQTGLVTGGESSVMMYTRSGVADYAPVYTLTEHAYSTAVLVANKRWFDRLSPAQQRVVREAQPTSAETRAFIRGENAAQLAEIEAKGIAIRRLTSEQRAAWAEATRANHAKLIAEIGGRAQEAYDLILKGKAEFARQQTPQ
jgi:TRAP-type C4-dicarboxylate transport system substrate-binding protein